MRRMTCGNWLSDTSTPVCLDSWDQWRCLQWRFRGIARQAVQIISLVGVLVYPCLTSFWQWWSRRWETSDIFSFSLLLSNLIRDLTKACFFFLSFWPMGKCCFYFFPFQMKMENAWETNSQKKTYFRSVKTLCFDKYASWYIVFNLY